MNVIGLGSSRASGGVSGGHHCHGAPPIHPAAGACRLRAASFITTYLLLSRTTSAPPETERAGRRARSMLRCRTSAGSVSQLVSVDTRFSTLERAERRPYGHVRAERRAGGWLPSTTPCAVTGASLTGGLCRQCKQKSSSAAVEHRKVMRRAAVLAACAVAAAAARRRRRRRIHVPRLRVRGEPHRLVRRRVGHRVHLRPGDVPYLCKQGRRPDDGARLQAPGLQLRVRHRARATSRDHWVTQWPTTGPSGRPRTARASRGRRGRAAPGWDDDGGYDDGEPVRLRPGSCVDDRTTTDASADCAWYTCNQEECGDYDDGDLWPGPCCACGAAARPSASDDDEEAVASDDGGDDVCSTSPVPSSPPEQRSPPSTRSKLRALRSRWSWRATDAQPRYGPLAVHPPHRQFGLPAGAGIWFRETRVRDAIRRLWGPRGLITSASGA